MGDDMPNDPVTDLAAGAAQLHELYESYVNAGFSADQAMTLVCEILRSGIAGAQD